MTATYTICANINVLLCACIIYDNPIIVAQCVHGVHVFAGKNMYNIY